MAVRAFLDQVAIHGGQVQEDARVGGEAHLVGARTAKCPNPTSIPVSANGCAATSTANEAKYRPAASLITLTLEGGGGQQQLP
jgi:hypothetical protein